MNPEVATYLEGLANSAESWRDIANQLQMGDRREELECFVFAFRYRFGYPIRLEDQKSGTHRAVFTSYDGAPDVPFPPHLDAIPEKCLSVWEDATECLKHPLLTSRLHDLLWVRKHGGGSKHAQGAIGSYIACRAEEEGVPDSEQRIGCLARALDICLEIKQPKPMTEVAALLLAHAERTLEAGPDAPGIFVLLVSPLFRKPENLQTRTIDKLDKLLERASTLYAGYPLVSSIIKMQIIRAKEDHARMKALQLEHVEHWYNVAPAAVGMRRHYYLEIALGWCQRYELSDRARTIRVELQSMTKEELGFTGYEQLDEVPAEEIERRRRYLTEGDDWKLWLERFGAYGPLSGSPEQNRDILHEAAEKPPSTHHFPLHLIGPYGLPIKHLGMDRRSEYDLSRLEAREIAINGSIASQMLFTMREKAGGIDPADLTRFFTTELIEERVAERIARAFCLFWNEQYDDAAHVIAPRIEAIIRTMCHKRGIVIFHEPKGDGIGELRTLGILLREVKEISDEGWWRYINNVLVNPFGHNLRNQICHGFDSPIGDLEATLLLHIACYLRLAGLIKNEGTAAEADFEHKPGDH